MMKSGLFRLIVSALVLSGVTQAAFAQKPPVAGLWVNCGGKRVGSWSRDSGCTNGTIIRSQAPISKAGSVPQAVYQSCRQAPKLTYTFPGLPNGAYLVSLHFAELVYNQPGARVFQVKVEGVKKVTGLDVFAKAGRQNRALRLTYMTAISDGNGLQVQLIRKRGDAAMISGIEVIPVYPPSDLVYVAGGINFGINPLSDGEAYTPYYYPNMYGLAAGPLNLSRTEVTKDQWDGVRAWAATNGYTDLPAGGGKAWDHPVQTVNWFDCVKWCNARSEMEGRTPAYYADAARTTVIRTGTTFDAASNTVASSGGYRLPTSMEWEYAARGGLAGKRFPWGDTISHSNANYFSTDTFDSDVSPTRGAHPAYSTNGTPYTCPVYSFEPNGFGLYGMAGNVSEWCWNWHPNGIGSQRVTRGGDYDFNSLYSRSGYIQGVPPDSRWESLGFRIVLPIGP